MSSEKYISVAKEFSKTPGPRFKHQGAFSGETFRTKILAPAIKNYEKVVVNLDNTLGFGPSFLDEAFGGLVRQGFSKNEILDKLKIVSDDDRLLIDDAYASIRLSDN